MVKKHSDLNKNYKKTLFDQQVAVKTYEEYKKEMNSCLFDLSQ